MGVVKCCDPLRSLKKSSYSVFTALLTAAKLTQQCIRVILKKVLQKKKRKETCTFYFES